MRKILILLSLLSLGVKAQIVGGYLPINSTKTPTVGGMKINGNLVATGTGSIGSTFTAGGGVTIKSQSLTTGLTVSVDPTGNVLPFIVDASGGGGNAELIGQGSTNSRVTLKNTTTNGRWFLSNNTATTGTIPYGFSIGTSSNPDAGIIKTSTAGVVTLTSTTNVFGNTTLLTSTSNTLTGGNTGTVAVLSDVYFTIPLGHGAVNMADATPYFFGNTTSLASSGNRYFRVNVPYACTLIGYDFQVFSNGVIGSSESATLSVVVNNSSTVTLNSAVSYTNNNTPASVNGFFSLSGTGFTTSLSAGDYIFGQIMTPTWGTNPTSIVQALTLYFKRN